MSNSLHIYEVGLEEIIQHFKDLEQGPDFRIIAKLDEVLLDQYAASDAEVHVLTGSLKTSGRTHDSFDGGTWTGELVYGGPAPGAVHDPVEYAIYERARGGDHDFLKPAIALEHKYEEVIIDYFEHP